MNKQAMPNQPIMNIAQPNQMINQAQKMPPINQVREMLFRKDFFFFKYLESAKLNSKFGLFL